jgi:hypothetical protein
MDKAQELTAPVTCVRSAAAFAAAEAPGGFDMSQMDSFKARACAGAARSCGLRVRLRRLCTLRTMHRS